MDQSQYSQLFSSGFEVASFVTSSDLLQRSWDVITSSSLISTIGDELSWKVYKEQNTNVTIIAFEATSPDSSNPQSFYINNHEKFPPEIFNYENNRTPLIVTGHGLGGAVASQLTISLLEPIGSAKNRLLCITFGSPLVGNKKMQEDISRSSIWNSRFLHVVSHKDPLPRLFIINTTTSSYTPFGTFLLCSDASSTCCDNPDSVLEILKAFSAIHVGNQGFQSTEYGNIVENLNIKAICKDFSTLPEDMTRSLETRISLQLQALGFTGSQTSGISIQQQQQNIDVNVLKPEIKKQEERFTLQRRISSDPSNESRLLGGDMAQLEWYKMVTKEQQTGYYDSYKKMNSQFDHDVVEFHKKLTIFWEKIVEESDMKPLRERMDFQLRWLYRGNRYRRMVEPLAIAQYYKDGGKHYINEKRPKHFQRLEEWWNEKNIEVTSRKNMEYLFTRDSCFWAHVEEALLSCNELNDVYSGISEMGKAIRKLVEFENYVYGQLMDYAVSPDIFLSGSSYMTWWYQYKEIKGSSYSSALANFMSNADNYNVEYVGRTYDFVENSEWTLAQSGTQTPRTQTLYHFLLKHSILCCCPIIELVAEPC